MLDLPLENAEAKPIRYLLHIALSFNGGNPDLISMLINFGMDVNERYWVVATQRFCLFSSRKNWGRFSPILTTVIFFNGLGWFNHQLRILSRSTFEICLLLLCHEVPIVGSF